MEFAFWLKLAIPMLLVPAGVGALGAWLAGRASATTSAAIVGAWTTALAFMAAYASFDWTSWKLDEFWHALPWVVTAAAVVQCALGATNAPSAIGLPPRLLAAAGAMFVLAPRGEGWEDLSPYYARVGVGFGLASGLAWWSLSLLSRGAASMSNDNPRDSHQRDTFGDAIGDAVADDRCGYCRANATAAVFLVTILSAAAMSQSAGISKFLQLNLALGAPLFAIGLVRPANLRGAWSSAVMSVAAIGTGGLMLLSFCETFSSVPWYCFAAPSLSQFLVGMGAQARSRAIFASLVAVAVLVSIAAAATGHYLA